LKCNCQLLPLPLLNPPPPKGRGRITEKTLPNPPPPSGRGRKKVGEGYSHLKRIKGELVLKAVECYN